MKYIRSLLALVVAGGILYGFFVYREVMDQRLQEKQELSSVLNDLVSKTPEAAEEMKDAAAEAGVTVPETTQPPAEAQLSEEVNQWMDSLTPEERETVRNRIRELGADAGKLLVDGAKGLLDKAMESPDPSKWLDALADSIFHADEK